MAADATNDASDAPPDGPMEPGTGGFASAGGSREPRERQKWTEREARAYLDEIAAERERDERGPAPREFVRRREDQITAGQFVSFVSRERWFLAVLFTALGALGFRWVTPRQDIIDVKAKIDTLVRADSLNRVRDQERLILMETLVKSVCLTMPPADQQKLGLPCDELLRRPLPRPIRWQTDPPPPMLPDAIAARRTAVLRAMALSP